MQTLVFEGTITKGVGGYVKLHVPGRRELSRAPQDWPEELCKGSLNVRIFPEGYPTLFADRDLPNTVRSLDTKCFPPCFEIAHHEFGNNQLVPTPSMLEKGSAQVWRALLQANGHDIRCWVLRRYDSGLSDQLELLSAVHLKSAYGINDGQHATVILEPNNGAAQQVI